MPLVVDNGNVIDSLYNLLYITLYTERQDKRRLLLFGELYFMLYYGIYG